jgi:trk system potassium uptake protein TrkH
MALQLPALAAWGRRLLRPTPPARPLTFLVLAAAAVPAVQRRDPDLLLLASTAFICGHLLVDILAGLARRLAAAVDHPAGFLRCLLPAWFILLVAGTVLLSLPLATRSAVPDYAHNFWNHVLASACDAVSAASLLGHTIYSFHEDHSPFGRAILLALTQLSGMAFAGAGLCAVRPFLLRPIPLQRLWGLCLALQAAGLLLLYAVSAGGAPSPSVGRWTWAFTLSADALWNSSLSAGPQHFPFPLGSGLFFTTLTTLSIVGSLGLPAIIDLLRLRTPPAGAQGPALAGRLATWEAGAAFLLLALVAVLLFLFETPRFLDDRWIPRRPFDLGGQQVALRDEAGHSDRWRRAVFVSATLRSAGLSGLPVAQGAVSWPSLAMLLAVMALGGAAGSAAAGARTTALLLPLVALIHRDAAPRDGPSSPRRLILAMAAWLLAWSALAALAYLSLRAATDATAYEVLVDSTAALSGVGLSTGLATHLTWPARLVMIAIMITGRLAPVAFWCGVAARAAHRERER